MYLETQNTKEVTQIKCQQQILKHAKQNIYIYFMKKYVFKLKSTEKQVLK